MALSGVGPRDVLGAAHGPRGAAGVWPSQLTSSPRVVVLFVNVFYIKIHYSFCSLSQITNQKVGEQGFPGVARSQDRGAAAQDS